MWANGMGKEGGKVVREAQATPAPRYLLPAPSPAAAGWSALPDPRPCSGHPEKKIIKNPWGARAPSAPQTTEQQETASLYQPDGKEPWGHLRTSSGLFYYVQFVPRLHIELTTIKLKIRSVGHIFPHHMDKNAFVFQMLKHPACNIHKNRRYLSG